MCRFPLLWEHSVFDALFGLDLFGQIVAICNVSKDIGYH